jgi:hypothetical protein
MLWFAYHGDKVKILGVTSLGLLVFSIPNPIFGIAGTFLKLILNRLMEYTSVFIIIITSYGLYYVFNKLSKKMKIVFMIFMFMTCFVSIKNDFTASDNPLVKREFYTFYLTTQEISSIETLSMISDDNYIMSDYQIWRFIAHSSHGERAHLLEVDYNKTIFFKERDKDLILIRESELRKRSLHLFEISEYARSPSWSSGRFVYVYYDAQVFNSVNTYNRNYDNGYVVSYN